MNLWNALWNDESGMILSAEAALLGTVGVVGATVGLTAAAHSINDELKEVAFSVRSLDQSYSYEGHRSANAWTAGSSYTQPPVAESQEQLRLQIEQQEKEIERQQREAEPQQKEPEKEPRKNRKRQKEEVQQVDPSWEIDGVAASR